jgi:hypothetical protein
MWYCIGLGVLLIGLAAVEVFLFDYLVQWFDAEAVVCCFSGIGMPRLTPDKLQLK